LLYRLPVFTKGLPSGPPAVVWPLDEDDQPLHLSSARARHTHRTRQDPTLQLTATDNRRHESGSVGFGDGLDRAHVELFDAFGMKGDQCGPWWAFLTSNSDQPIEHRPTERLVLTGQDLEVTLTAPHS